MTLPSPGPDADCRTLHLRCGSDLLPALRAAGFLGDFLEHAFPYATGIPAADDSDPAATQRALEATAGYDRVVIWSEHDVHDQLVLVRLLAHYAAAPRPPQLEMITISDWPAGEGTGRGRFLGLGQLSAAALAGLWPGRVSVEAPQLACAAAVWAALAASDPTDLIRQVRAGLPALPLLVPALWRHLQELPDGRTGLSLSQRLALQALDDRGPQSLQALFRELTDRRDPLPGQGDLQFRDRLLVLEACRQPLFLREPAAEGSDTRRPWTDRLTLTPLGRAVLKGALNAWTLGPAPWRVGGVQVAAVPGGRGPRFTAPLPPA
ncbi:MAG: hypothetical protein RL026_2122 [Pseudomonadota bacterium]|jgi:hypothetical protein